MSRDAIMVSNTTGDMSVTSERAMIFSAAWRAASVTNADLVTWSRSAASEMSWSVASSVRSSRRRVLVVVMVIPPHTTVRDLYGRCERGAAIDGTPRARLRRSRTPQKYGNDSTISRASYPPGAPRTCSATANAGRAASLQAGGPGFDSPCLHPGQRPLPLVGGGLFDARTPEKLRERGHTTLRPNSLPTCLSTSLVEAEDTCVWMSIVTVILLCRRIVIATRG